jgi:signal transduction histidine kinase
MQLILYRGLAGGALFLVAALWFYQASTVLQQRLMLTAGFVFILLIVAQWLLALTQISKKQQWLFQFTFDALLAGILIFSTGGIYSPFSFILGLIIIASGTLAFGMLPLGITVLSCICYLAAVYGEIWYMHGSLVNMQQALHILLQVSAWMLVGGVMAFIARRHAHLRASSDNAARQNQGLREIHLKVIGSMSEGIVVLNRALQISDMNEAARKLLGQQTMAVLNAVPGLQGYLHHPTVPRFQCEYQHSEKTALLVAATQLSDDDNAAWLLTIVDISEIRRLEQELIQQEKMAMLGQMAAMLAHEIRNPIHTMTQGLELIDQGDINGVNVQGILHDEMLRLNRLVSTMLNYARPLKPAPVTVPMQEMIKVAIDHIDLAQHENIYWQCSDQQIFVDADHFRLVIDNLLSNALANRLEGSVVEVNLDADNTHWFLRVRNSGTIADSIREKLFEPFASASTHGIGLGLATVKQACDANGWLIDVGCGTGQVCFTVIGNTRGEIAGAGPLQVEENMELANG